MWCRAPFWARDRGAGSGSLQSPRSCRQGAPTGAGALMVQDVRTAVVIDDGATRPRPITATGRCALAFGGRMNEMTTQSEAALIAELNDLLQLDHDAVQAYALAISSLKDASYQNTLRRFRGD